MKMLILLITLLTTGMANAGDLLLGQLSHHLGYREDGGEFRETHPLIGYAGDSWSAVYMKNSYDNDSVMVSYRIRHEATSNMNMFAAISAATGYAEYKPNNSIENVTFFPLVGLEIHPSHKKYGIVVSMLPGSFISTGLKFNFN